MKLLLALLLSCISFLVFSQSENGNYQPYDLVPVAPEVASLGKFIEQPVSKYTGLPQIDIPLYEIKYGNIIVPIVLSYHAGGVRVDDIASRVGMNWSLKAGGFVGRSVRGRGDFYTPQAILSRPCWYDEVPDDYYYSFSTYYGKFSFLNKASEPDGQLSVTPMLHDHNNLKLVYDLWPRNTPINFTSNKFIITTPDGLVYTFDARERTMGLSTTGGFSYEGSSEAWYLTEILDPLTNKKVTFEYTTLPDYNLDTRETKKYYTRVTHPLACECQNDDRFYQDRTFPNWISSGRVLTKIKFGDGSVVFKADVNRQDLPGDVAYSEVAIYYKTELLKGFTLNVGHVGGATAKSKRLILSSIQEFGKNRNTLGKPPYKFEYDNMAQLPPRGSYEQDLFGFYNANNATTPEPLLYVYPTLGKDTFSPLWLPNAGGAYHTSGFFKQPHEGYQKLGHLKSITYPTGGKVEYEMESNSFMYYGNRVNGGGLRIRKKSTYDCADCVPEEVSYSYFSPGGPESSGAINSIPKFGYMCTKNVTESNLKQGLLRSTENMDSGTKTAGSYVGYSAVTETTAEGRTIEYYDNPATIPDQQPVYNYSLSDCWGQPEDFRKYDHYPFYPAMSRDNMRGKLLKSEVFDKAGTKVREIIIEYKTQDTGFKAFNCGEHHWDVGYNGSGEPCATEGAAKMYTRLSFTKSYKVPKRVLTTEYFGDGSSLVSEENATFDIVNGSLVRLNESTSTAMGKNTNSFVYLFTGMANDPAATFARNNNFVELKTSIQKMSENSPIGAYNAGWENMTYEAVNGLRLSSMNWIMKTGQAKQVQFLAYDAENNPTKILDEKGVITSYSWLPGLRQVTGIARNANINEFAVNSFEFDNTAISGQININHNPSFVATGNAKAGKKYYSGGTGGGTLTITGLESSKIYVISFALQRSTANATVNVTAAAPISLSSTTWKNYEVRVGGQTSITFSSSTKFLIDDVRITVEGSELTSYTYEPLIGITSETDPNGFTISYEYDDLGRLKLVRDTDRNILKRYVYNYIQNKLVEH